MAMDSERQKSISTSIKIIVAIQLVSIYSPKQNYVKVGALHRVTSVVSGVVSGTVAYLEPRERCQRIASSGCYKNSVSDNLNSRNTRLFETDQINFNSSALIGSYDGTNLSLIWLINAPIHSFIQVEILEPWIGCGSSLGKFHFRWSNIKIGI